MTRMILLFALAVGLQAQQLPFGSFTHVSLTGGGGGNSASLQYAYQTAQSGGTASSPAMAFPVTTGHTFVGFVWFYNNVTLSTITTSKGDTCTTVPSSAINTSVFTQEVFYCLTVAGGSGYTATATFSGSSSYSAIYLAEYGGITGVDVAAHNNGPNGATMALASALTPTVAGDLVFAAGIIYGSGNSYTPAANFALHMPTFGGSGGASDFTGIEDSMQGSASPVTALFTTDGTGEWGASVVAFKTQTWTNAIPYISSSVGYLNSNALTSHTTGTVNNTGASAMLVFIGTHNPWNSLAVSISGVTDTAGNTWTPLAGPTLFTGASWPLLGAIYYCTSPKTATNDAVTVSLTNPAPMVLDVYALTGSSGLPVTSTINSPAAGTGSTSPTAGPITVPANTLLIAWEKNETAVTSATTGAGFEKLWGDQSGYLTPEFAFTATGGSFSSAFNLSGSTGWQSAIVGLSASTTLPTFDNSVAATGVNATTISATFTVAANATVLCAIGNNVHEVPSGVSDGTNAYIPTDDESLSGSAGTLTIWMYKYTGAGGSKTITATSSAGTTGAAMACESWTNLTGGWDQTADGNSGGAVGPTGTTAHANEVVFTAAAQTSSSPYTACSPGAIRATSTYAAGPMTVSICDLVVSTIGTESTVWTADHSNAAYILETFF